MVKVDIKLALAQSNFILRTVVTDATVSRLDNTSYTDITDYEFSCFGNWKIENFWK